MQKHSLLRLTLTFSVALWSSVASLAADFVQPEPLEPAVAGESDEAAETMAGIRIPAGWQIQLYAAEPNVANVVAFDIDLRGRMFVCESFRQNHGVTDNRAHDEQWLLADLAAETVQDRIDYHKRLLGEAAITYAQHDDRVRRLIDSDSDGKIDRSTVLANGFNHLEDGTGAGILARGDHVYYTCIPKLWKLIDQDDDGVADERVVLSDGYGVRVAFRGHDMHGLIIGPDGRLYFSIGDRGYHVTTEDGRVLANPESGAVFRCELDGSGLEVFATGMRNPQELAFNDLGDLFSVDNNSDSGDMARIIQIVEDGDAGWRMQYQYFADRGPFNRDKIWEPFHQQQPAYIIPPIANLTDGPSGLAYYPGTGFGDQLNDTFLICDFRGGPANSGIRSFRLDSQGAFYRLAEDADPIWTLLATDAMFGPDGAIYISDWVDGWEGLGKGRIYRLIDPEHHHEPIVKEVQKLLAGDWTTKRTAELTGLLDHKDRRVRFEAQWELASRGETEPLLKIANSVDASVSHRLHAVWGADQIARTDPTTKNQIVESIRVLLNSDEPILRAAAAKVAGERADTAAKAKLQALLSDASSRVRYFAAMSLGKLAGAEAFDAVVQMLAENNNQDPVLRHAGACYLSQAIEPAKTATLKDHPSVAVRRAAVVALRQRRDGNLALFLDDSDSLVVGEAARAIHDLPVPVGLEPLAAMIQKPQTDRELMLRIVNANYRLGTNNTAMRLAEFAGRNSASPEMRIEALTALSQWASPDPRDRVVNAFRPLQPRAEKEAASALTPQIDALMASEESVREKAIEVASSLGIKKIVPLLVKRIESNDQRASLRANSLSALARLDQEQAVKLARQVKLLPTNELLLAALKVLAASDAEYSLDKFIEATQSRNTEVRQLGWDILAQSKSRQALLTIVSGVQEYLDGSLPPDVHLNVLEASQGKLDDNLSNALLEHQRSAVEADAMAPWLASLDGGDVEKGKKTFFEKTELSCVRCHKVDRAGGEVGPNLTVIGKEKTPLYLLESICIPDAQIAKGFETAVVANDSGQVFSGIVKSENDEFIELIQNDGTVVRVPGEEIVARRKGKSSMPDDLTKFMSARELRDLVAYLASLKVDPREVEDTE